MSLKQLLQNQQGQTLVEYAYIMLFIALACIVAFSALGINVLDMFDRTRTGL